MADADTSYIYECEIGDIGGTYGQIGHMHEVKETLLTWCPWSWRFPSAWASPAGSSSPPGRSLLSSSSSNTGIKPGPCCQLHLSTVVWVTIDTQPEIFLQTFEAVSVTAHMSSVLTLAALGAGDQSWGETVPVWAAADVLSVFPASFPSRSLNKLFNYEYGRIQYISVMSI